MPKTKKYPDTASLLKEYLAIDLSDDILAALVKATEWTTFEADDIIYRNREKSNKLYIVHSGHVDVQYLMPNGRRETVDTCYKGEFFMWSSVVPPHETNSIGICRARAEVMAIDGEKLRKLCETNSHFGYKMMGLVASVIRRRLRAAHDEIVSLRD